MGANAAAIFVLISVLAIAILGKVYFNHQDRRQMPVDK